MNWRPETWAKLACGYTGLVWGLFWLPVRKLSEAGITGLWANLIFYAVPFAIVLPVALWRRREIARGGLKLQALSFSVGVSLALYSLAILHTEVVRAMLLFYLTPFWSLILAWAVLGEKIRLAHWLAMALAALGLGIMLRADAGVDLSFNAGDAIALGSGLLWAVAAVLLRASPHTPAVDIWAMDFFWCAIAAVAMPAVALGGLATSPPLALYLAQLPWLVPISLVVVMSGVYFGMWGARQLNPGIVGLLFMTELSAGAITAALWAGERFGWREMTGIVLITLAGMLDSLWDFVSARLATRRA